MPQYTITATLTIALDVSLTVREFNPALAHDEATQILLAQVQTMNLKTIALHDMTLLEGRGEVMITSVRARTEEDQQS